MKVNVAKKSFERRREDILKNARKKKEEAKKRRCEAYAHVIPVREMEIGYTGKALLAMRPLSPKEEEILSKHFFLYKRKDKKVILSKLPIAAITYEGAKIVISPILTDLVINGRERSEKNVKAFH